MAKKKSTMKKVGDTVKKAAKSVASALGMSKKKGGAKKGGAKKSTSRKTAAKKK